MKIGEIAKFIGDTETLQESALRATELAQSAKATENRLFDSLGIYYDGEYWVPAGPHHQRVLPREEVAQIKRDIQVIREERNFFGEK